MKRFRKLTAICLTVVMSLSIMTINSLAAKENISLSGGCIAHPDTATDTLEDIRESYEIARALPHRDRDAISLMRAYTTVTVNAVCDSDWLTVMSSEGLGGLDDAEFIIDEISEFTESEVGVHLYGYAITANNLTQTGTNGASYIDEAWSKYGKGTRDMMIAFYGVNFGAGGWAYYGLPKCALFLQDYDYTWQAGRHETGHMYDVWYEENMIDDEIDGDCLSTECVMNNNPYENERYNKLCDDCTEIWVSNKDMYPQ